MLSTLPAQSSSKEKLKVLLLSSEWWSRKGGISTLNRKLAIQLANHPSVAVTVFLPECSEEEKEEAVRHNINIVKAIRRVGFEENVWLCFPPSDLQIDFVIGHGAVLGPPAKLISDYRQCNWVQIVHTIPKELGMFKTYGNPILKSEMKHKVEVELSEMAALVVGVGPKLSEAFQSYLGWKNPDDVVTLTPGIFNEYSNIEHVPIDKTKRRVLVYGRGDEEDFVLKGFDIAAKAVTDLSDTILIFAGAREEDFQQVTKRFLECGISPENLQVRGFLSDRKELIKVFSEVDLVLMPSRAEGFGLTGLEALSAGLPVLVSRNTGFGEALTKIPFGDSYVVNSKDATVWAKAIKEVLGKVHKRRIQESNCLRTWYREEYDWKTQCEKLVEKLFSVFHDKQEQEMSGVDVYSNQRRRICPSPPQERMVNKPSTPWQGGIDKACLCHTRKQQIEDEADPRKQLREEKEGPPERSGGGQRQQCVTHQHNLHVQEIYIREELSLQVEESVQESRLEGGPTIIKAKANENITRNVSTRGMQSADSTGQEALTTRLESFLGDSKDQCEKTTVMEEEELTHSRSLSFLTKPEGRSERLENAFSQMHQKSLDEAGARCKEEDGSKKSEAIVEEWKKSLEEEQQLRARMEGELRQTQTLCTEMEETIHELVQTCLASQSDNDLQTLKEQERNNNENIARDLKQMLRVEQEAKTEADNLAEVRKENTNLRERFVALEQNYVAQMIANSHLNNLREQELREKETHIAELLDALDETQHAKLSREKELTLARKRCVMLEQQLESERYVPVSRQWHPQADDWKIPREHIVLGEILGQGGWGTVVMGTFRGCQVAVKQMHNLILSPHNRAMFEREMRIVFRCHHPNILQFIGATFDDGSPLLVTELLDASLRNLLEERPLPLKETVTIALDVAKGLNYLHLNTPLPILHRDVTSTNVLLWKRDQHWRAKLGDFGAANFMRKCMTVAPGALSYSAPETFTRNQTTKVDVYSFGVLLCEMCIRELPDPEIRHEQILKVSSSAVQGLIRRCVLRNPEERPSVRDVIPFLSWIKERD